MAGNIRPGPADCGGLGAARLQLVVENGSICKVSRSSRAAADVSLTHPLGIRIAVFGSAVVVVVVVVAVLTYRGLSRYLEQTRLSHAIG